MDAVQARPRMHRGLKPVLLVVSGIGLGWAAAWAGQAGERREHFYKTEVSPRGTSELILMFTPPWGYGPHTIHAYTRATEYADASPTPLLRFLLENDGKTLTPRDCAARWPRQTRDVAVLTCKGEDQDSRSYVVDVAAGRLLATTDPRLRSR